MFVMIQHTISDPETFWNAADPTTLSPKIKLHHTFPTPDGTRAVCIWEGDRWMRSAASSSRDRAHQPQRVLHC